MKRINIKLKFLLICFVVVFCFLTSCRTIRQDTQKSTSTAETLIREKETYRDTILFTPKAETTLNIPVSELVFKPDLKGVSKPKIFVQKNGNATAKVEISPHQLTVTASCDSLAMVAKIKRELYEEISATTRSDTQNNNKKTGYTLFDILITFFVGLVIGAVITFILNLLKIV